MFLNNKPVYIIAEIGQNHQGDIEIAKKMIALAKSCGVDCVKFQKSHLPSKFNHLALSRPYVSNHAWGETYGKHKEFLEFNEGTYYDLQKCAKSVGIDFTASAMDITSLHFLKTLGVPFIKIGSGDACNAPFLREAASLSVPLLLSTGMCDMADVKAAYNILSEKNCTFGLMHCVSSYPTPQHELNLNVIPCYKTEFPDVPIGYSGHELGIDCTLLAVQLGATIIERHFTLNKSWKGSDHACSLTPIEMTALVSSIRNITSSPIDLHIKCESALGGNEKTVQCSEQPCIDKLGKTLVASRELTKGQLLTAEDIGVKVAEPKGIHCRYYDKVLGRCVLRNISSDDSIQWSDLSSVD